MSFAFCYLTGFSQEKGTFKDSRDGKVYRTVKIGNQTWFAENLAFKPKTGKYWVYNKDESNVSKYGYLYGTETAQTICPVGWHLPNQEEWSSLINYLNNDDAGIKMKSTTGDWEISDKAGTNESGFNALPAGIYIEDYKKYMDIGMLSYFLSSSLAEKNTVIVIFLTWGFNSVCKQQETSSGGRSVRCLKD